MTARFAFPVLYGTIRLHVDKGRQWSAVEHLILSALCKKPHAANDIAKSGNLPRRLVIESIIRLMRAGWVELFSVSDRVEFRATSFGNSVVLKDILPAATRPESRYASFVIDKISGSVFRSRDLTLYTQAQINTLLSNKEIKLISYNALSSPVRPDKIVDTLLDEDELFRGMDSNGARFVERFAVVTVYGESIEGIPRRAPTSLKEKILNAAQNDAQTSKKVEPDQATSGSVIANPPFLDITFDKDDFILGGKAHKKAIETAIRRAKSWIVIHSTFVNRRTFETFLPILSDAAHRGVRIDILWGKKSDENGINKTAEEIAYCRTLIEEKDLSPQFQFHAFSTNSHSKILIADDGRGHFVSIIGSCNWFSSGYSSYEVSARFRDPIIVAELAGQLSSMAIRHNGIWSKLARDLAGYATNIRKAARPTGKRIKATLVHGAEHNTYITMARDNAHTKIVVASHRFGGVADTAVLIPTKAAIADRNIEVTILFGRPSGTLTATDVRSLVNSTEDEKFKIRRIYQPHMHCKFLVWDNDHVLITSQNWLSSDPLDSDHDGEIGVFLSGSDLGSYLLEQTSIHLPESKLTDQISNSIQRDSAKETFSTDS